MTSLVLELAAPLQSWGDSSQFSRRLTRREPTKSGVIGLIAAAQGRRRIDPVEDLVNLKIGVRIDQPGVIEQDFQTTKHQLTGRSFPMSYRFYLADAVFLVVLEANLQLLEGIREALQSPEFPLYLGRRAFPPSRSVVHGMHDGSMVQALADTKWIASPRYQRRTNSAQATLEVRRDLIEGESPSSGGLMTETVRDVPLSFSQESRQYDWRTVVKDRVVVRNPSYGRFEPDFLAALEAK